MQARPAGRVPDFPESTERSCRHNARKSADLGFLSVFSGLVVAGALIAWVLIVREQHFDAVANNPLTPAPSQSAAASDAGLPANHPKIQLPAEAIKFIQALKQKAEQNPNDLALWDEFGDVAFRAALLDPTFYEAAARAYTHVLKRDPDNLGALRGIGNVNYDRHHYDEATAAYEHYLKQKPDDPAVRTDLGTLYLYTGNADQAVRQYDRALRVKPDFFEAYFNLGVAYNQLGQSAKALAALNRALTLAPDDRARKQVRQLIAEANGAPPMAAAAGPGQGMDFERSPAPVSPSGNGGAQQATAKAGAPAAPSASSGPAPAAKDGSGGGPLALAVVKVTGATSAPSTTANGGSGALNGSAATAQSASTGPPSAAAGSADREGGQAAGLAATTANPAVSEASAGAASAPRPSAGSAEAPQVAANDAGASSAASGDSNGGNLTAMGAGSGASGAGQQVSRALTASASDPGSFANAIEDMLRQIPIAGPRVKDVQWPSQLEAKVLLENFPMDQMPPFVKEKFLSDIKQGIDQAKKSWRIDQPFRLEFADAGTGRVMETVTQ
jgi:tetratricopeptide (TPR) repeat protein